jgi:hypothetical protein
MLIPEDFPMRRGLVGIALLLCTLTPAFAQVSINFGGPEVSIGINVGTYPTLQRVPGYPVYYAPGMNSNYFFYDGLYWVFQADTWYASSWYNGPWSPVDSMNVPVYLWRVPVRYYRHPPSYFKSWRADDAPRWGEHWGSSWQQRHSGWDQWNRNSAPPPAPLPTYQRQYSGSRYPQGSQQAVLESQNYRYQPTDPVAQQHFQQRRTQAQAAPQQQPAPQRQPLPTRATQQHPSPETGQQQSQQPPQPPAPQRQPMQTRATQQHPSPETSQQPPPQQTVRAPQAPPQPQPAKQLAAPQPNPLERKAPPTPLQHDAKQAPPQREAQPVREAPRPQSQERAPQGKPPENKEQGRGDNRDNNKDNKDKEKGPER